MIEKYTSCIQYAYQFHIINHNGSSNVLFFLYYAMRKRKSSFILLSWFVKIFKNKYFGNGMEYVAISRLKTLDYNSCTFLHAERASLVQRVMIHWKFDVVYLILFEAVLNLFISFWSRIEIIYFFLKQNWIYLFLFEAN